jgi:small subunit ribosomal protein S9
MAKENVYLGTGRRKTAVARVRMMPGSGKITINGRSLEDYCYTDQLVETTTAPLVTAEKRDVVDLSIRVEGGGPVGQAGAMRLGIARALQSMDEELRAPLKKEGYFTRDPRKKERKKSGQPGARKKFQFSKR